MNPGIEGFSLGLAYAMPIGAQNIFVLQNAARDGFPNAFRTAAIVATMDIALGLCCFYGIGLVLERFPTLKPAMVVAGALFLLWFGMRLALTRPNTRTQSASKARSLSDVLKAAFVLTWLNPHALMDGSMLLGGYRSSLVAADHRQFLCGMALASCTWFFSVSSVAGVLGSKISGTTMLWINRSCGALLVILGAKLLMRLIFG